MKKNCFIIFLSFIILFGSNSQAASRVKKLLWGGVACGALFVACSQDMQIMPRSEDVTIVERGKDENGRYVLFAPNETERRFTLETVDRSVPSARVFDGDADASKKMYANKFNDRAEKEGVNIPVHLKNVLYLEFKEAYLRDVGNGLVELDVSILPYKFNFKQTISKESLQRGDLLKIPLPRFYRKETLYEVIVDVTLEMKYDGEAGELIINYISADVVLKSILGNIPENPVVRGLVGKPVP